MSYIFLFRYYIYILAQSPKHGEQQFPKTKVVLTSTKGEQYCKFGERQFW